MSLARVWRLSKPHRVPSGREGGSNPEVDGAMDIEKIMAAGREMISFRLTPKSQGAHAVVPELPLEGARHPLRLLRKEGWSGCHQATGG